MAGLGGFGGRALAQKLGSVGVWSFALQRLAAEEAGAAARAFESDGYAACWIPESLGSKELFSHAALLLAGSERIAIASGIANIHARDPMAMANGAKAIGEAYPGRFVLGIGVSHANSVATRGGTYEQPLQQMRVYLDALDAAQYAAPEPDPPVPLVLAALGPRMLELAAERADGAHPYFVPVDHTPFARKHLGAEACLAVEQTAVLTTDLAEGRRIARAFARHYLAQPNYANNLRRLGWSEADVAGDGSDAVIDAVIAIGDVDAIVARVRAHLDAGADHVCVQFRAERSTDPALGAYRELAAALDEIGSTPGDAGVGREARSAEHPNAALVRRFYAARARDDRAEIRRLVAADVAWHDPYPEPHGGDLVGLDAVLAQIFDAAGQLTQGTTRLSLHDVVANDEHVIALVDWSSELGEKRMAGREVAVYHMRGGQIREAWFYPEDQAAAWAFFSGT